ncbi:MAG: hypothetical protein EBS07_12070, partial [Sphingobacteriia bacterium]|nr:hypothetical protein [Sphingobacteriia bacterium]
AGAKNRFQSEKNDLLALVKSCLEKNGVCKIENLDKDNSHLINIDIPMLEQNQPNPFNQITKILYYLPDISINSKIIIYDVFGNTIKSFDNLAKGNGSIEFDRNGISSSSLFYKLVVDGIDIKSLKMILE